MTDLLIGLIIIWLFICILWFIGLFKLVDEVVEEGRVVTLGDICWGIFFLPGTIACLAIAIIYYSLCALFSMKLWDRKVFRFKGRGR